jgi:hypothetical protein
MAVNEQLKKLELQVRLAWVSMLLIGFFTGFAVGESASLDLMIIAMCAAHILYLLYVWRHLAIFFNENQE